MSFTMMDPAETKFQLDLDSVAQVHEQLMSFIRLTPMLRSSFDPNLVLKAENLQVTGSFKVRPAFAQVIRLTADLTRKGIVTSSSGNFALATAYVANLLGFSAKIVMMRSASPLKIERTQRWGGEVVFCEDRFEARAETVAEIVAGEQRTPIAPYDHPDAILGNATLGLEILEQYPQVEHVAVPVSGGGLISGIAATVKLLKPSVKIFGVQAEGSNAAYLSFRARQLRTIDRARTMADGLTATCPGKITFPLILENVDEIVTVSERSILAAVQHFVLEERLVVEPSGAVPLAAVIEGQIPRPRTVLLVSGGNASPVMMQQVFR
jgi:threonine dehydratase